MTGHGYHYGGFCLGLASRRTGSSGRGFRTTTSSQSIGGLVVPQLSETTSISRSFATTRTLFAAAAHCKRNHSTTTTTTTTTLDATGGSGTLGRRLLFGRHVSEAMANGEPIVALESTVITHGLPEPQNLELALQLEQEVRAAGCTPTTLGIIRGQIVVGLNEQEIQFLAERNRSRPIKASRRDIPLALAGGLSAGTTVAATMAIACHCVPQRPSAAIKVFATGGTGGVHRGGEHSMDISADLYEFARSPMGVVSSGFKSFLDTRRSLEFLETLGCTVISLDDDDDDDDGPNANERETKKRKKKPANFPAFYSRNSGVASPFSVASIREAAEILYQCLEGYPLAGNSQRRGLLMANPIAREHELTIGGGKLDEILANISSQVDRRTDLEGKEKTPLILEQINRQTGGKSLRANVELLRSNARVGAKLAIEYANILSRATIAATGSPSAPLPPGESPDSGLK